MEVPGQMDAANRNAPTGWHVASWLSRPRGLVRLRRAGAVVRWNEPLGVWV